MNNSSEKINLKVLISIMMTIVTIGLFMLLGFVNVTSAGISFNTSPAAWLNAGLTAVCTLAIAFSVRGVRKEKDITKNQDIQFLLTKLGGFFKDLTGKGKACDVDAYLLELNRQSKYNAYLMKIKSRMANTQSIKKRKKLEQKLHVSVDDVWYMHGVHYSKVTYSNLFSGINAGAVNDDEHDIKFHEGRGIFKMLTTKMLFVIGFNTLVISMIPEFVAWDNSKIFVIVVKIFSILMATISGISNADATVAVMHTALQRRVRIVSDFYKSTAAAEPSITKTEKPVENVKIEHKNIGENVIDDLKNGSFKGIGGYVKEAAEPLLDKLSN